MKIQNDIGIIDAHSHIFPLKIAHKAVESIGNFYNLPMCSNSATAEDLILSGTKIDVKKYIISSTATTESQVKSINNFILSNIKEYPQFYGLITLHPDMSSKDMELAIQFGCDNNFKGIKLHPDFQKFYIDEPRADKIYQIASGVLPILFHTGDKRYEYSCPARLAIVAKQYPNLTCIAAHFGGYERWNSLNCYDGLDNVYFDTSSSLFKLHSEEAVRIIRHFGVERFMFGADFPMWQHAQELAFFDSLPLTYAERHAILRDNAINIYNLTYDKN